MILLILGLGLLSGSALLAFSWAARSGQFDDLDAAARVIFEPAELEAFDAERDFSHGGRGGHGGSKDFLDEEPGAAGGRSQIRKSGRDGERKRAQGENTDAFNHEGREGHEGGGESCLGPTGNVPAQPLHDLHALHGKSADARKGGRS